MSSVRTFDAADVMETGACICGIIFQLTGIDKA